MSTDLTDFHREMVIGGRDRNGLQLGRMRRKGMQRVPTTRNTRAENSGVIRVMTAWDCAWELASLTLQITCSWIVHMKCSRVSCAHLLWHGEVALLQFSVVLCTEIRHTLHDDPRKKEMECSNALLDKCCMLATGYIESDNNQKICDVGVVMTEEFYSRIPWIWEEAMSSE